VAMILIQIVMLLIIGGFILTINTIDELLKSKDTKREIRRSVSKRILMVAVYVHVLLTIILIIESIKT
jgi:hypothetical protein